MLDICDPNTAGTKDARCNASAIHDGRFHAHVARATIKDYVVGAKIYAEVARDMVCGCRADSTVSVGAGSCNTSYRSRRDVEHPQDLVGERMCGGAKSDSVLSACDGICDAVRSRYHDCEWSWPERLDKIVGESGHIACPRIRATERIST
jgi:hypothetical protein